MRLDRFTIKSQEVVQKSQALAAERGNQQIEPEHLLAVMLGDREGIAVSMLRQLGASPERIAAETLRAIERLPRVGGAGMGESYLSNRGKALLEAAFTEAGQMKDEYVSIEHILLALLNEKGGEAGKILAQAGVTRDAFFKVLKELKASQMKQPIFTPIKLTGHFQKMFLNITLKIMDQ
jgi:ATP-dependent Clp protease ATP-binding subunit ClpB